MDNLSLQSNISSNGTTDLDAPSWNHVTVLSLGILLLSLTLNSFVLALVAQKRHLRTSFNIYVISLLTANITYNLIGSPLDFLYDLYPNWWLGWKWCTVYMYGVWVISSVQTFNHFIITMNRFCATALPVFYRRHHGFRAAVALCSGAWVAAHLLVLPGVILDAELYRQPLDVGGCDLNVTTVYSQKVWMILVQFSTCAVLLSVLFVYPYILRWQRSRRKIVDHSQTVHAVEQTAEIRSTSAVRGLPTNTHPTKTAHTVTGGQSDHPRQTSRATSRRNHDGTTLLTILTTSLLICWSPATIYYAILPFDENATNESVGQWFTLLFGVQAVMDPILFAVALRDVRSSVLAIFRSCRLSRPKRS